MKTSEKHREMTKRWYQNNRERAKELGKRWRINNPERMRDLVDQSIRRGQMFIASLLRGQVCVHCGSADDLVFHHRNPDEKSFSISGDGGRRKIEKILAEIAKCDVLCRKCHATHHNLIRWGGGV